MNQDIEIVIAELAALKILLLSAVSAMPNKDAVVDKYTKRLAELESHTLYEATISDDLRQAIVQNGQGYAATVLKWGLPSR